MKKVISVLLWVLFGSLSVAISFYPLKYLLADKPILLLLSKSAALISSNFYMICFNLHIIFGGIALLIGWVQFSKKLQRKYTGLHRWIGKVYMLSVLISGIPGFYIALHASGGLSPKLGFSIGAVLWVALTIWGYTSIRKGNVELHKKIMTYNYAGTFGAVTLRLWLPILILIFGKFTTAYQVVAWLSWLPNMLVVYLMFERKRKMNYSFYSLIIPILIVLSSCASQQVPVKVSKKTRSEKWVEDIDYFEDKFLDKAKTYTKDSKAEAQAILTKLKTEIDKLSDFQIRLTLAKCVVLADNGHTTLPLPLMDKIPLRFYRFSDGMYVVKTDSLSSKYLGARVLKINSIGVNQLEAKLFPYLSGIERWKKFKTIDLITAPKVLHEIGFGKKDSLTLTLVKNSDTLEVGLRAKKIKDDRYWFESWANLYPLMAKKNKWKFIKNDPSSLPLYLRKAEEGVFYSFNKKAKMAYFQINGLWEKCPNFKEKINNFLRTLKLNPDYNVVIDLRFYTGGNYNYATKLATGPPKIINENKKIYLITSHKTYSAGIVTAARIKHFAKDKIVVVGEEVGDRLKFWAESKRCKLPNSGIRIYSSRKEHDWKDNKRGLSRTHFPNFIYGVAAKNLKVDKEIALSFKGYQGDKDPILEWIMSQQN